MTNEINVEEVIKKWTDKDSLKFEIVGYVTTHVTPRHLLLINSNGEAIGICNMDDIRRMAVGIISKVPIVRPPGEHEVSI